MKKWTRNQEKIINSFGNSTRFNEANWNAYVEGYVKYYHQTVKPKLDRLNFEDIVPNDIRKALTAYFIHQDRVDYFIHDQALNELGGLKPIDVMESDVGLRALKFAIMRLY